MPSELDSEPEPDSGVHSDSRFAAPYFPVHLCSIDWLDELQPRQEKLLENEGGQAAGRHLMGFDCEASVMISLSINSDAILQIAESVTASCLLGSRVLCRLLRLSAVLLGNEILVHRILRHCLQHDILESIAAAPVLEEYVHIFCKAGICFLFFILIRHRLCSTK